MNFSLKRLFKRKEEPKPEETTGLEEIPVEELEKMADEAEKAEIKDSLEQDQIVITNRSMLAKLNSLTQLIKTFSTVFPLEYKSFSDRIEKLKKEYRNTLEDYIRSIRANEITFEIDPDDDSKKRVAVVQLANEINAFIENDFKYHLIFQRLEKFCYKLNALYNTSIRYSRAEDKRSVLLQLERAEAVLEDLLAEAKEFLFSASDKIKQLSLIDYLSYADYMMFQCKMRNDAVDPEMALSSSNVLREFKEIDIREIFRGFILDELENLVLMIQKIKGKAYYHTFFFQIERLKSSMEEAFEKDYWNDLLGLEDEIVSIMLFLQIPKDDVQIAIPNRVACQIEEKEIFQSVQDQVCLALASLAYKTQDLVVSILLDIISQIPNISYKEVYFLFILFNAYELIYSNQAKMTGKAFLKQIREQHQKYGSIYSRDVIEEKKSGVLNSTIKKRYIKMFQAEEQEISEVERLLHRLKLDYVVTQNEVYLNSFYFSGMENILAAFNKSYSI